jgi:hypothetical protein
MTINTILAAALGGAAAGALGGGATWAITKRFGKGSTVSKVGRFLAIVLAVAASRFAADAADRRNMEEALLDFGPFRALHDHYPADYAEMVRAVRATADRDGTMMDFQNAARPAFMAAFQRQLPLASDQLLVEIVKVNADEGEALKGSSPDRCVALMAPKGDTVPFPVAETVPKPLLEREARLEEAILRDTAGRPPARPPAMSDERLGALFQAALAPIPETEHAKLMEMAQGRAPQGRAEETLYCSFLVNLMRATAAAEPAGPTIRSVLFGG